MSGSTLKKSSSPEKDLDVSSLTEESGAGMEVKDCQNPDIPILAKIFTRMHYLWSNLLFVKLPFNKDP